MTRLITKFESVENWLRSGADTRQLRQFNLSAFQMEGVDKYGNVQFTGYYTPVLEARLTQQGEFDISFLSTSPLSISTLPILR